MKRTACKADQSKTMFVQSQETRKRTIVLGDSIVPTSPNSIAWVDVRFFFLMNSPGNKKKKLLQKVLDLCLKLTRFIPIHIVSIHAFQVA